MTNLRAKYLPQHWQDYVVKHPDLSRGQYTPDFSNHVFISFEDRSYSHYTYAFAVISTKHNEIAVFTEHCGYHCFNLNGIEQYGMLSYKTIKELEDGY